jgi:16S rRNA (cytidine1402-2'-O)-methyltransferase
MEKDTFDKLSAGTLYIVATPIGNLEDITLRALRVLKEVDTVFCEDTRVTKRLLGKYDITTPMQSLNARTEKDKTHLVIGLLSEGKNVAYVSDAGTPAISDPGAMLVKHARAAGARVEPIPGPSALTAALSVAGVPASDFLFLGFLPHKKGRQTLLREIADPTAGEKRTVVLYESTHRIIKLLKELHGVSINRYTCLARELTKIHEEVLCGTPEELLAILEKEPIRQKGEFVVLIYP